MRYFLITILLPLTFILSQDRVLNDLSEAHNPNLVIRTDPPTNLIATGGEGQITLTWDVVTPDLTRSDVTMWISNVTEEAVEISMLNTENVYGFDFSIVADPILGAIFGSASGGSAEDAGFMVTSNPDGGVLGFSIASYFIPQGEGILTSVNWTHTGSEAFLDLSITFMGELNDGTGIPLSFETGAPFCYGICDPAVITYNVYRDGSLFIEGINATEYVDGGLGYSETHCYTVTATDGVNQSDFSNEACATTLPGLTPTHLSLILVDGQTNLTWDAGDADVLYYVIYHDGIQLGTSEITSFYDDSEEHCDGCYVVTAMYPNGESDPSNEACLLWTLINYVLWIESTGEDFIEIMWTNFGYSGDNGGNIEPSNTRIDNRDLVGTEIYRDGEFIHLSAPDENSFVDLGIDDDTHCYVAIPMYFDCPGSQSNEVCGSIESLLLCPPDNFDLIVDVDVPVAHLTWDAPGDCGDGGNGDVLITIVTDQWASETSWNIVDSNETYIDGTTTGSLVDFNSYTWNIDLTPGSYTFNIFDSYGDGIICSEEGYYQLDVNGITIAGGPGIGCDFGTGMSHDFTTEGELLSSSEFHFTRPLQTEKGLNSYDMLGIENVETIVYTNETVRTDSLIGYRIFRDGYEITNVGSDVAEYDDFEITIGIEQCWHMDALYDDGISENTVDICSTLIDEPGYSQITIEGGTLESGESGQFDISLYNPVEVAGFQFTMFINPDSLYLIDLETTERTDGWLIIFNEQSDGTIIFAGFSLDGSVIESGEGPILTVTFEAEIVETLVEVEVGFDEGFLGGADGQSLPILYHSSIITILPFLPVELIVGDGSTIVDENTSIEISLSNESVTAGFQFTLFLNPDIATLIDVLPTDRTNDWTISINTYTGNIIGFNLFGVLLAPGEGPIIEVVIAGNQTGVAEACLSDIVMSNQYGYQIPVISSCGEIEVMPVMEAPIITGITSGNYQIDFNWILEAPSNNSGTAYISISNYENNQLTIYIENSVDIASFQLLLNSDLEGFTLTGVSGGSAEENGFVVSTNNSGLILGLSLEGTVIPAGEGILIYADVEAIGDFGCFTITSPIFIDADGISMGVNPGDSVCINGNDILGCTDPEALNYDPNVTIADESCIYGILGCTDPEALNYNPEATLDDGYCMYPQEFTFYVYRDGDTNPLDSVFEMYSYSDSDLGAGETHCYTVTAILENGTETDHSNEMCATTPDVGCTLDFYADLPSATGEASLIIVQGVIGIEVGECDEIGVFDANAILNSGNCDNDLGELLVGAGVWESEQLAITAVGSLDYCDIGGNQFPGYVVGNPIIFKYYHAASGVEYLADATFLAGNGTFGQIITSVVLQITACCIDNIITLNPFMNNMFSTNILVDDPSVSHMFSDEVLIVQNDTGDFYVPQYGIDMIGDLDYLEGYAAFINGSNTLEFEFTGSQIDQVTPFTVNPFMSDMIPYFGRTTMPSSVAFGPFDDDILFVYNDSGEFYVPSYGIDLINNLVPGEGYVMFLNGASPIEFSYPADGLASPIANEWDALKPGLVSQHYDVVKTGIVYPIIITDIQGDVAVGDEIAVYAHGTLVGATRVVDTGRPLPVTAWGEIDQLGIDVPGYTTGDAIEIRYWSQSQKTELIVSADLDGEYFGLSPLTIGRLVVHSDSLVPTQFSLSQNYPNPFNPNTTIEFSVPHPTSLTISIYDITGKEIRNLIDDTGIVQGYHNVIWDGLDNNGQLVSAGLYIYTMTTEGVSVSRKMILMK